MFEVSYYQPHQKSYDQTLSTLFFSFVDCTIQCSYRYFHATGVFSEDLKVLKMF